MEKRAMRAVFTPRKRRWNIEEFIDVIDIKTGEHVGHVLDINTRGISILSKQSLVFVKPFRLRLVRQVSDSRQGHSQFIDIIAQGCWQKSKKFGRYYQAGLRYKVADAKSKIRLIRFLTELRDAQLDVEKP